MDKTPPDKGPKKGAPVSTKVVKANARAERLRAQLRQNLHKRKAQSRARKSGTTGTSDTQAE